MGKDFDDTDDFLAEFMGGELIPGERIVIPFPKPKVVAEVPLAHTEVCPACGGSGRFRSYSGRVVGQCFKCKGLGHKTFKTSATERATAKVSRDTRKANVFAAWVSDNDAEYKWLDTAAQGGNAFAASLLDNLRKYGSLTEGQLSAVRRNILRVSERKASAVERVDNAPAVTVEPLELAFQKAREADLKYITVRLAEFVFSPAKAGSSNPGAIYVKEGSVYLGKILGGKFLASRDCTPDKTTRILAVAANPGEEARAYGRLTGTCSCCGRELTDPKSIAAGIGPICANNFGF